MSAIILEILKEHPNRIFTQTEIIEEIKKKTGKIKSKSAVSQNITTLSNKNKIIYEKGIGRTPAKISLGITDKEKPKPKPIEKPKPTKPKPKPIEKVELVFEKQAPDFNDYQLTDPITDKKESKLEDQLSQAEKSLSDGIEEFTKEDLRNKSLTEITEETSNLIDIKLLTEANEMLAIAKETIINQEEEITNLEVEMAFVKGIKKIPFTFKEFSKYMLSQSEMSGSNSMKMGEIAYRKTSLKNIYLIILHLRDENKL